MRLPRQVEYFYRCRTSPFLYDLFDKTKYTNQNPADYP